MVMSPESVVLSAFADEGANSKTAIEQYAVLAALGLRYYSPRFVDVEGSGEIQHVTDLKVPQLKKLAKMQSDFGLSVTSIGSRVGKVKLVDVEDGSHNKFVPFAKYLKTEVKNTLQAAKHLGAKMIRGFSFYHPQTEAPEAYVNQAAEQLAEIVEMCAEQGVIYALEVEANLIGQNGVLMAKLARKIKSPNVVLIFDGGNLSTQNMSQAEIFDEYVAMRPYLGYIHVKDYRIDPNLVWEGVVDEERLKNFVPANVGDSGHELIFRDLIDHLPKINKKMQKLGLPGTFMELEPHLKGGGQFGGFSGPDGLGVALRALTSSLDYTGIQYQLRTMADIVSDRGF